MRKSQAFESFFLLLVLTAACLSPLGCGKRIAPPPDVPPGNPYVSWVIMALWNIVALVTGASRGGRGIAVRCDLDGTQPPPFRIPARS